MNNTVFTQGSQSIRKLYRGDKVHYTNGAQELDIRLREVEVAVGVIEHKQAAFNQRLERHDEESLARLNEIKEAIAAVSEEIKQAKIQLITIETEKVMLAKRNENLLKFVVPVFAALCGIALKYVMDLF